MSWHVYPVADEREHETEGNSCWCDPVVEWLDPVTNQAYEDGPLVVHNASDFRELVEQAEEIKASAS